MRYSIFRHIIESDISLPELPENDNTPATLFFRSSTIAKSPKAFIDWCHHWRLPNGQISISVGKENNHYWIRFPQLADFKLKQKSSQITAYRHQNIPDNTIRHLLLDQVIPRLLSQQGQLIIHASCIQMNDSVIVFCGESGWGKSTLAAYFYQQGNTLITDDCLLLETHNSSMTGIPNYQGLRLLEDSISLLPDTPKETTAVCHYASKQRIPVSGKQQILPIPISTIFILNDPNQQCDSHSISIEIIPRAAALIELIKHCFPMDITDSKQTGKQFANLAKLINSSNTQFYRLTYPRTIELLPSVLKAISKVTATATDHITL